MKPKGGGYYPHDKGILDGDTIFGGGADGYWPDGFGPVKPL